MGAVRVKRGASPTLRGHDRRAPSAEPGEAAWARVLSQSLHVRSQRNPSSLGSARLIELLRKRLSDATHHVWLLKTPNATKSLEFLDSPTQYRRHASARAIDRLSACMPIP